MIPFFLSWDSFPPGTTRLFSGPILRSRMTTHQDLNDMSEEY